MKIPSRDVMVPVIQLAGSKKYMVTARKYLRLGIPDVYIHLDGFDGVRPGVPIIHHIA
jgi:hypothetical protein